ncbi:MAG TPA: HypC/HybG/HupF family hydrogenase formation chaperone [Gallionella sp.]|nr:HypC/HybG/HupF family hydrogenase formation chaperone [Gallionella sp.]
MCIGIPMRVVESGEATALCEGRSGRQRINMLMVGHCPAGSWVMTFLGVARETLTEEDADHINRTLDALEAMLRGDFDLADLP